MERQKKRTLIQIVSALVTNGNFTGFLNGTIYRGPLKNMCVPGLNCYSCPGAFGSCPIGSLQAVAGGRRHNFSFYVFGLLTMFGVFLGRVVCGFLCPFGLVQDLLHRIPSPKIRVPEKPDRILRFAKYGFLLILVLLLPVTATDSFGNGEPFFCKWVCPAGTLEGAVPLLLKNEGLRESIGFLFYWKFGILLLILFLSVFLFRPFCKYICPLGAFYSLFNKISFRKLKVDRMRCTGCRACENRCPMDVKVLKDINSAECIRCGKCMSVCASDAIHWDTLRS